MAEYRPSAQWDRGLPSASAGANAKAGVVIHQIRNTIGTATDGAGYPKTNQVCLAGIIPVPSTGDLDWSDGAFAVRVVASDTEWVDLLVGATLPNVQSVSVTAVGTDTFVSQAPAEAIEVARTKSDCGVHAYTATTINTQVDIAAEAVSSGFANPRFRYELNGVALNAWTGPATPSAGSANITAAVRVPTSLAGAATASRTINVTWKASANKIAITVPPGDGSFELSLVGFAADNPVPAVVGTASAPVLISVVTASIQLPPEAIADQGLCIARIADEMRQVPRWPGDGGHPDWRVPNPGEHWSRDDLAQMGREVRDAAEFARRYPALGDRRIDEVARRLDANATDVHALASGLSRHIR